MRNIEMHEWLYWTLTRLDYAVRDIEQAVVLSEQCGPDIQRAICHIREKCEDAAKIVRC